MISLSWLAGQLSEVQGLGYYPEMAMLDTSSRCFPIRRYPPDGSTTTSMRFSEWEPVLSALAASMRLLSTRPWKVGTIASTTCIFTPACAYMSRECETVLADDWRRIFGDIYTTVSMCCTARRRVDLASGWRSLEAAVDLKGLITYHIDLTIWTK
jgi:hypothetical protein